MVSSSAGMPLEVGMVVKRSLESCSHREGVRTARNVLPEEVRRLVGRPQQSAAGLSSNPL